MIMTLDFIFCYLFNFECLFLFAVITELEQFLSGEADFVVGGRGESFEIFTEGDVVGAMLGGDF